MELSGRTKASVLWGAIGALAFLVLAEVYLVISGAGISLTAVLVTGFIVFILATIVSWVVEPRIG